MGYSISWLSVNARGEAARARLGLRYTGARLELPKPPFVGAELSTGWYVVVANRCDHALIADPVPRLLSADADVVACSIEEHVMVSRASCWARGAQVWSVAHDAQRAIDHLAVVGELPAFFSEVRDPCLAQQAAAGAKADVDYVFDVPMQIAARITGFKHDGAGEPAHYDVLELVPGSILARSRPWWKFW